MLVLQSLLKSLTLVAKLVNVTGAGLEVVSLEVSAHGWIISKFQVKFVCFFFTHYLIFK